MKAIEEESQKLLGVMLVGPPELSGMITNSFLFPAQ